MPGDGKLFLSSFGTEKNVMYTMVYIQMDKVLWVNNQNKNILSVYMQMGEELLVHIAWYGLSLRIFQGILVASLQDIIAQYSQVFLVIFPGIIIRCLQDIRREYFQVLIVTFPKPLMKLFQDIIIKYFKEFMAMFGELRWNYLKDVRIELVQEFT